jgi:hypothetical protein
MHPFSNMTFGVVVSPVGRGSYVDIEVLSRSKMERDFCSKSIEGNASSCCPRVHHIQKFAAFSNMNIPLRMSI